MRDILVLIKVGLELSLIDVASRWTS